MTIKADRLKHNNIFDKEFESIENLRSFPYVGKDYGKNEKRILVYAHNIYCPIDKYKDEVKRKESKLHYANPIEEYTHSNGKWTFTFRNFVKANVGLNTNYSKNSSDEILQKINSFVENISYTNYIDELIPSDKPNNIKISEKIISESRVINIKLIKVLKPTHIVCWGKQVYNYILSGLENTIIEQTKKLGPLGDLKKKGFGFAKIKIEGKNILVLKVFHPSMPGYGVYKTNTQKILKWFYNLNHQEICN